MKLKYIILCIVGLLAFVLTVFGIYNRSLQIFENNFKVTKLSIESDFNMLDRERIKNYFNRFISTSVFHADIETMKVHLMENNWVKSVSINKVWPDTLNVVIEEYEPVAVFNDDMIISASGIFHPVSKMKDHFLPYLYGEKSDITKIVSVYHNALKHLKEVEGILTDAPLDSVKSDVDLISEKEHRANLRIVKIEHIDQLYWQITTNTGLSLYMDNDIEMQLNRFVNVANRIFNIARAKEVRLYYSDGFSVSYL